MSYSLIEGKSFDEKEQTKCGANHPDLAGGEWRDG